MFDSNEPRLKSMRVFKNRLFIFTGLFKVKEVTDDLVSVEVLKVDIKVSMIKLAALGVAGALIAGHMGSLVGALSGSKGKNNVVFLLQFTIPVRQAPLYIRTDDQQLIEYLGKKVTWQDNYGRGRKHE
jgi:hypothetical protein